MVNVTYEIGTQIKKIKKVGGKIIVETENSHSLSDSLIGNLKPCHRRGKK
jgi:hypothetical protein